MFRVALQFIELSSCLMEASHVECKIETIKSVITEIPYQTKFRPKNCIFYLNTTLNNRNDFVYCNYLD